MTGRQSWEEAAAWAWGWSEGHLWDATRSILGGGSRHPSLLMGKRRRREVKELSYPGGPSPGQTSGAMPSTSHPS